MILNEAQQQIRDMARDFARERLAPGAASRDRESRFPKDELKEMGALGFLGMLVSEDYGGRKPVPSLMLWRWRKSPLVMAPVPPS
jgi:butyryl-CoA dehydrogenase